MCAGVAVGLGLPAPEATESLPDVEPSPALSQVGQRWPTTGWVIGLIADQSSDLPGVRAVRDAVSAGGMVPLIIAAYGGMLVSGESALSVQRTFLTSRSVEFDAILIAGAPQPAADAAAGLDAKAGDPLVSSGDGRPARHAHACGGLPARQGTRRLGTGGAAWPRPAAPPRRRVWCSARTRARCSRSSSTCSPSTGLGPVPSDLKLTATANRRRSSTAPVWLRAPPAPN